MKTRKTRYILKQDSIELGQTTSITGIAD